MRELLDQAIAYHNRGALKEAERHYRQVLNQTPRNFEARHLFGILRFQQGRHQEAIDLIDAALKAKPDFPEALYSLGNIFSQLERHEEAIQSYDRALAIQPRFAEAYSNRGSALFKLNRLEEAVASFNQALAIRPDYAEALNGRGTAMLGLRQFGDALASFDKALAGNPFAAGTLYNRANALKLLKRHKEAIEDYNRALAINPNFVNALIDCAEGLSHLSQYDQALIAYDKALAIEPANMRAVRGLTDAALNLCDWSRTEKIAAAFPNWIASILPFTALGYCDDPALQRRCAEEFTKESVPVVRSPIGRRAPTHTDKIRIAYISADFNWHATAYLIAELFELHDRSRFEVLGISFAHDDGSDMRRRLVKAFDQFHDVQARSDLEIATLLNDLDVDIAVDLKGHSADARLKIFAYRPAPIQVNYLVYPGTTGAGFIDYIIADKIIAPFEHEPFYTEKIVHLPDCYQVNDSTRGIAERTPTRQEAGLPDSGFVFCCFNRNYKITAPVFDVWMRLLKQVPGSVLWLLRGNAGAENNLRREAQARDIDPARLIFADRKEPEDHLARHRLADLFLDTLPYNAHTTASDALWAGLPVLTCQGAAFPGRVSSSLLQAVGLPELVTHSLAEYEALALRLATEPELLRAIREKLARNRLTYPLFDTDRFRKHIEAAYLRMWENWQRGDPPRKFSVPVTDAI